MKKTLLLVCLSIFSIGFSQEKDTPTFKRNEIKLNAPYLLAGAFDVTYERILNEESGVGADLLISFNNDLTEKFSFTGFYRYYFGKKPGMGFFVEGFGSLNQFDNTDGYQYSPIYNYNDYDPAFYSSGDYENEYNEDVITDFALGFGIGAKWVTKKGFIFEFYGGIGRNLFNDTSADYDQEFVGRGGINLGYRF